CGGEEDGIAQPLLGEFGMLPLCAAADSLTGRSGGEHRWVFDGPSVGARDAQLLRTVPDLGTASDEDGLDAHLGEGAGSAEDTLVVGLREDGPRSGTLFAQDEHPLE